MAFDITRADVWAGEIEDRPGSLASQLETLHRAGVDLDTALMRPAVPLSGTGVLFLAPLIGPIQQAAARQVGLRKTESIHAVRILGPDRPGLMAHIARSLADAGLAVSGFSAAAIASFSLSYFRFETPGDADRAVAVLRTKLI